MAIGASVILIGGYAAVGGGRFTPTPTADPCRPRPWVDPRGIEEVTERLLLTSIDGAACELKVGREDLLLALQSPEDQRAFSRKHNLSTDRLETAVREGVRRAVTEARSHDAINDREATIINASVDVVPIEAVIELVQQLTG
jgi:hypothetical protein